MKEEGLRRDSGADRGGGDLRDGPEDAPADGPRDVPAEAPTPDGPRDLAVDVPADGPRDGGTTDAPGDATPDGPRDGGTVELGVADRPADARVDATDATTAGDAARDATGGDAPADTAAPLLVTLDFTGEAVTISGTPLGFDSTVRMMRVSGTLAYDLRVGDSQPADPLRGRYLHTAANPSQFTFKIAERTITGSGFALVQTENLNPDTFRFVDGPQIGGITRILKVDGVNHPDLDLWIAISNDGTLLTSDAQPSPFPVINIATTAHTFYLMDDGGTLLMQLDTLVQR